MQRQKIELYAERTFSRKLSDTFDFLSENGKVLFKFLAYLLLPVSAVQALGMNFYAGDVISIIDNINATDHADFIMHAIIGYAILMLSIMTGAVLSSSLVYGLVRLYGKRQERLQGITMSEMRPVLLTNIWRTVKMGIVIAIIMTMVITLLAVAAVGLGEVAGLGNGAAVLTVFIGIIAVFACGIPLALTLPIYLIEDDSTLWESLTKAFRLGFKTWGGIFGVLFVIGFIVQFIQGVSTMPWYIMLIFKGVLLSSDGAATMVTSPAYTFGMYLFGVVQAFGMYVGYTIIYVATAILYGHAAEKTDGVSVERDVDNFEQMGDDNDDDMALFDSPKP
ncbi:hypothetical protein [Xylanibacter rodentium]|uniref:Transmembrane protein n=1 Tax=Xylanibacter rodentium TaxID=2736289 RepID=A0ABX2AUV2_9BACT|nr:hypothetical protein [Xylanibacter rodentium]NPE10460.1 hypothetical protein [Prevotella sp. PJ1A]NPE14547.1 hypothetical protein [Xylanibacter rodentium]NPE37931.1 hypothetical protein [Prevotella sp. PCJ2]